MVRRGNNTNNALDTNERKDVENGKNNGRTPNKRGEQIRPNQNWTSKSNYNYRISKEQEILNIGDYIVQGEYITNRNGLKIAKELYHATPKTNVESIGENGIAIGNKKLWKASVNDGVYLTDDIDTAKEYVARATGLNYSDISVYKINAMDLDINKMFMDENEGFYENSDGDNVLGSWVYKDNISKEKINNRYKLTEDSDGRKLTEVQQKFFKDSKVVDEDGNLLVVYHKKIRGCLSAPILYMR